MKFEVEILSKEIIKPCYPTPSHLRNYQLSFLDQLHGHNHISFVMFFPHNSESQNVTEISHKLKKSLSHVLSRYYPLAGRLKDDLFVNCNDEGIPFLEAQVNCELSDVVQNPDPHDLHKFIPFELDDKVDILLGIQLNIFSCGGVVIGSRFSHKIEDALSTLMFLKFWAAATRGGDDEDSNAVSPQFVSATHFPPKDVEQVVDDPKVNFLMKNVITKRFVFESSKLEALKEKFRDKTRIPSRVEALSAFIYARVFVKALDEINYEDKDSYDGIARQAMRELMINGSGKEHVKNLQEGVDQGLSFLKEHAVEFAKGDVVPLNFTSFCRFSLYQDFGWGKPSWVGKVPLPFKNFIVFMDTKTCDGIEVYIDLEKDDMARLEIDDEFLSFVSST
ncbi:stemmadenine O-acetyltransferase-like isoform X1 [Humulus lupulus]|uniref:stemmadenine O-acetyltransferase-like isoform X1 n=1 Tax=Humulus lupulus TaxID=3486 RepID=UPI002B405AF2|nr:stemmadenine O-acetyltransferase-like isoform X1 [Humulus lupulus]